VKATYSSPADTAFVDKGWMSLLADLTKARLTLLVLLTTLVGFYMGWGGRMDYLLMFHALWGTALLASGAGALNQLLERDYDARMRRTSGRPLPSGRLQPVTVMLFGGVCSAIGIVYLAVLVNLLTAVLGAVSLVTYLFVYTPLKRVSWLNTAVGAVPGALPPLMGWTAARGGLEGGGWSLFALLALWQMPHFFAIAWMYREEYAKAGFVMLPVVDADGSRTGNQAVGCALALLPVSLCPVWLHLAGIGYLVASILLGAGFLFCAVQFARKLDQPSARRLFFASIIYLPLLLIALVAAKTG
jgi:protoheme IX farnesyltransferase